MKGRKERIRSKGGVKKGVRSDERSWERRKEGENNIEGGKKE